MNLINKDREKLINSKEKNYENTACAESIHNKTFLDKDSRRNLIWSKSKCFLNGDKYHGENTENIHNGIFIHFSPSFLLKQGYST